MPSQLKNSLESREYSTRNVSILKCFLITRKKQAVFQREGLRFSQNGSCYEVVPSPYLFFFLSLTDLY